jgi:hypothetical protein
MAEQSAGSAAIKMLGALVSAALGGLTWLSAAATGVIGLLLAGVLAVLSAIGAPVAFIIYRRYVGVLGAGGKPKGSPARQAYDELRDSLSGGNLAARLYSRWLTAFLDTVDRFFGDAGKADQTLFPHAFGLKTPAPLWTAPAFDRCLLLALIYPIVSILVIWAISGHVGPAEAALGFARDMPPWRRGLAVTAFALAVVAGWRAVTAGSFVWTMVAGAGAGAVVGAVAGAVAELSDRAIAQRWHGFFLSLFLPAMIIACLVAASLSSSLETWEATGPLLLFLGLLTLLNAPFDWASLGLTRALLRRGLELAGWWPYLLAIVDAALAALIVAALA